MTLVPEEESATSGNFSQLGVCKELCASCERIGWQQPTRIQIQALPVALKGRDVIGISQTGSGKTAAYAIPILQALLDKKKKAYLIALVLCPTRELAVQVCGQFGLLGKGIGATTVAIFGGVDMVQQAISLTKRPHVVVGTPGRVKDHLQNTRGFTMNKLEYLVLDEADKILDMDFEQDVEDILALVPTKRVTSLYSATMTTKVEKLQRACLKNPVKVEVLMKGVTVDSLQQHYVFVPYDEKKYYLVHILNKVSPTVASVLVFCEACHLVQRLCIMLRNTGHKALPLYGQMTQEKRLAALERFRNGQTKILVCTDVASRGLDIPTVDCVINYSLPMAPTDYVHRVGRTARAGRAGLAVSVVSQYDIPIFQKIETLIRVKMTEYPTEEAETQLLRERVDAAARDAATTCKDLQEQRLRKRRRPAADEEKGGRGTSSLKRRRKDNEASFRDAKKAKRK